MRSFYFILLLVFTLLLLSCNRNPEKKIHQEKLSHHIKAIDTMTRVLLKVISGEAGENRDWKRFKNLFLPGASLTGMTYSEHLSKAITFTLDEYISSAEQKFSKTAFFEMEFTKTTEVFGSIAHVFQVFILSENKGISAGKRGINSIHLIYDQGRWWITDIIWDYETPQNRIPSKYLGTGTREILPS